MAYGYFKDLTRRTASDKILRDKTFNIVKKPMVYELLIKKVLVVVLKMRIFQTKSQLKNYQNELLENLRKEKYTHLL